MTQEEKSLLLKDLCARLPYGIKGIHREQVHIITNMDSNSLYPSIKVDGYDAWFPVETFKPYLRPMSSMTEEQRDLVEDISNGWFYINEDGEIYPMERFTDSCQFEDSILPTFEYLYKEHLDFRGLIEKGLALEAPEGMYEI